MASEKLAISLDQLNTSCARHLPSVSTANLPPPPVTSVHGASSADTERNVSDVYHTILSDYNLKDMEWKAEAPPQGRGSLQVFLIPQLPKQLRRTRDHHEKSRPLSRALTTLDSNKKSEKLPWRATLHSPHAPEAKHSYAGPVTALCEYTAQPGAPGVVPLHEQNMRLGILLGLWNRVEASRAGEGQHRMSSTNSRLVDPLSTVNETIFPPYIRAHLRRCCLRPTTFKGFAVSDEYRSQWPHTTAPTRYGSHEQKLGISTTII